jgi:hypothetical protein
VIIIPASPPFYHRPETLDDLVEQFVDKVVTTLGFEPRRKWRQEVLEGGRDTSGMTPEERQALGLPDEGLGVPTEANAESEANAEPEGQ